MEVLVLILSGLISLVSPIGFGADRVTDQAIRGQFKSVEQLAVRIDAAPVHQILQGEVNRIRIAGRGLFPMQDLRLEALEIETDAININRRGLMQRRGKIRLEAPLQAGIRLVMKEADLAQALKSPVVLQRLQKITAGLLKGASAKTTTLVNPQVKFLANQRIRLQADLQEADSLTKTNFQIETGLEIVAGKRLKLVNPKVEINGQALPDAFVQSISDGFAERYDLGQNLPYGITAKILKLELEVNQLELALLIHAPAGIKL